MGKPHSAFLYENRGCFRGGLFLQRRLSRARRNRLRYSLPLSNPFSAGEQNPAPLHEFLSFPPSAVKEHVCHDQCEKPQTYGTDRSLLTGIRAGKNPCFPVDRSTAAGKIHFPPAPAAHGNGGVSVRQSKCNVPGTHRSEK